MVLLSLIGVFLRPGAVWVASLVYYFAALAACMYLVLLMTALRYNPFIIVLFSFLTVVPCANLLTLLAINGRATRVLRDAGLSVGFMGVRDEDVVRKLDPRLCGNCGYDLTGNTSGRCPECGTPNPRIARASPLK